MKERKEKDKKEILVYDIFAKVFLVLGFISVFMGVILENQVPDGNWMTYSIVIFFLFIGVSFYLQNIIKKDKEIHSLNKKHEKYKSLDLKEVSFNDLAELKLGLEQNSYELLSNGYYFKKVPTHGICYYAKFINSTQLEDVLEKEIVRLKKFFNDKCRRINGIIFFFLNNLFEEKKNLVRGYSQYFLMAEEIPLGKFKSSVITVLLDEENKKAYYLDVPVSFGSKIYSYGCLVLNKIFKE